MKIIGYSSKAVLNGVKILVAKKTGFNDKEFEFIKKVMEWHESTASCCHENLIVTERVLSNGTVTHWEQCQHCGWGKAVKKQAEEPKEKWSEDSHEIRNLMWTLGNLIRNPEHNLEINDDFQKAFTKAKDFQERHHNHLMSKKWHDIRSKVLTRAGGICEGCLTNPAQEVHHKTYAHLGNEFCFELIALCRDCHSRYHGAE